MDSVVKSCTQTKATTIALKTVETTTIKDLPLPPSPPLLNVVSSIFFSPKTNSKATKLNEGGMRIFIAR